ncbi:predicted protein [Nematostella vectensis]|uniref:Uncharacterized protein n=1 Tax=Nematostella vectensis TaxID=45351 RepID=A7RTA3_NEMVE|nr:predicted protein [Nematostella vectensis]|eukprot:XP_001637408.1 predicted protein [Nematostella vectensis]
MGQPNTTETRIYSDNKFIHNRKRRWWLFERRFKSQYELNIICVGDFTYSPCTRSDILQDYINHRALEDSTTSWPTVRVRLHISKVSWSTKKPKSRRDITVNILDISQPEIDSSVTRIDCFREAVAALVFCGPHNPNSLSGSLRWRNDVIRAKGTAIPMVLVVDNLPSNPGKGSKEWIGPGLLFGNREEVDQFCSENGFFSWHELSSGDGYSEAMERAINCLIEKVQEDSDLLKN